MRHLFYGNVKNGKLKVVRRGEMEEIINSYEGKKIIVSIELFKNSRSVLQNNYYWGVVVPMVRQGVLDMGMKMNKEEIHEMLKLRFLKKEKVNEDTGEIFPYIGSTTEMTKMQFMEYIQDIQQWSATYLNVVIPSPGEQLTLMP